MKDKTKASNVGIMSKGETSSACHNHEQMESDDNTSFDDNVTKIHEDKRENEQISVLSTKKLCSLAEECRESCKNIASILYDVGDYAVLKKLNTSLKRLEKEAFMAVEKSEDGLPERLAIPEKWQRKKAIEQG